MSACRLIPIATQSHAVLKNTNEMKATTDTSASITIRGASEPVGATLDSAMKVLARAPHVFATAAKIPESVSGRISDSHRSFGRTAKAIPRASGAAVTTSPANAVSPSCLNVSPNTATSRRTLIVVRCATIRNA